MVADLLASDLEASRLVRAVGPGQLYPMIEGLPSDAAPSDIARAVTVGTMVDYVLMGTLYREGDEYLATVDVVPSSASAPELPAVRAAGVSMLALSEALASYLRRGLPEVSRLTAWRDDRTELEEINSDSEEARMLYERGLLAMRDGKIGEAIGYFEGAVEEDEDFAIAHARLASVLHSAGYGRKAREAASRAMDLAPRPNTPAAERLALSIKATWAEVFGRNEEAKEATEKLATIFSDEPIILAMSAQALLKSGDYEVAQARIDRALEIDPVNATLHHARAEILMTARAIEGVHTALDEAERLFGIYGSAEGVARTEYLRGQTLVTQELYEEATAELERAEDGLASSGNEVLAAKALLQMAEIEILQGRTETAMQRLTYAAEMADKAGDVGLQCKANSAHGALLFMTGEYEQAEGPIRVAVDLARQLENDQILISPLANLASLNVYLGRRSEARGLLEETGRVSRRLGNKNGEISARLNIADVDYQNGKLDEALAAYEQMLSEEEGWDGPKRMRSYIHMGMAEVLERRGALTEALDTVTRAIALAREIGGINIYSDALARRAQIYAALGRFDESSQDLREARSMGASPDSNREWMEVRLSLAEGIINARRSSWREALSVAERVRSLKGGDQPAVAAASRSLACEALIALGRPADAAERCSAAVADEAAPAAERAIALALMAQALYDAGSYREARERALEALAQAEEMKLLLPTARAAGILASLPKELWPEGLRRIVGRGRNALESYIAAVPDGDRRAVREREDVKHINAMLENSE
jgi:tetratricopeptide (TPR) repeat protein